MCLVFILRIKSHHLAFGLAARLHPKEKMFSSEVRLLSKALLLSAAFSIEVRFQFDFETSSLFQQYNRSPPLWHLRQTT